MPACGWCASSSNSSAPMCVSSASVPALGGGAHRFERGREVEARLARHLHAQPEPSHRLVHVGDQRPADADGEVEARLLERAVGRIEVVVDQVDAAAERELPVDARRACGAGGASASAAGRASRAPGCRRARTGRRPSSAPATAPGCRRCRCRRRRRARTPRAPPRARAPRRRRARCRRSRRCRSRAAPRRGRRRSPRRAPRTAPRRSSGDRSGGPAARPASPGPRVRRETSLRPAPR